jgi:transposase
MQHPLDPALSAHYSQALGLTDPWKVTTVTLDTEAKTLDIEVLFDARQAPCPECGASCSIHNLRERRSWRHLDMMQFTTTIHAQTPRSDCATHGVKTIRVPWADAHSRFTLLFEHFAIEVLLATASVTQAQSLLHLSWDAVQRIKERAVLRGLTRRKEEAITYIGIDEKSFLRGHKYASLMTDLDQGRVLDVVQDRTRESADLLIKTALSDNQRTNVKAVAMDMWSPFMSAWRAASTAPIVHDKFHISSYLGEAVNAVRKSEHRTLMKKGDTLLKGAKYLFLKNELEGDEKTRFRALMKDELKVGRAWTLKEAFRHFWEYVREGAARSFFVEWYFRATHSRLDPIIKVAKMLKRHLAGLLAHCAHDISNAVTEGLNSKIQTIKANARGFRTFENYRIAILFGCGKLNMMP